LDQIVVAPEAWGSKLAAALMAEAKRLSPSGLDLDVNADNARAIRFYEKQGFALVGEAVNRSGAPIYKMSWRPRGGPAERSMAGGRPPEGRGSSISPTSRDSSGVASRTRAWSRNSRPSRPRGCRGSGRR